MAKKPNTSGARTFTATLERMRSRLNWVIVRVPLNVAKVWETRGQLKVKGEINGFAFRTSLFPTGEGSHILMVNKTMQRGGGVCPGSVARFRLEPDSEERVIAIPVEWKGFLTEDRSLRRWYERLSYSSRREIAKWIGEPKGPASRARRAEQMAERLLETMDAELELPPILQVAFARNPKAREGWEQMGPGRRRGHLLGIFYYRTPEGRANRIAKMMADAEALADKKADRNR